MRQLLQRSRLLIVFAITAASGALAGGVSNRWAVPADLVAAGEKLEHTPNKFGDWELRAAKPFDPPVVEMLQCVGSTERTYQNIRTGAMVQVALFVGPPGPTSVHTPDVCFTGANFAMLRGATQTTVRPRRGSGGTFWDAAFQSQGLEGETLRVLYAWNDGGRWSAAKRPRIDFAGSPLLYKLMVVSRVEPDQITAEEGEICREFLAQFLPALDSALVKVAH